MKTPLVSVIMITYGHDRYINQAIEGVLNQECNFDVELIVANDCSPDDTDSIVKEITKKHSKSNWIKYTKHLVNKGMQQNFLWACEQAKSKYIALCEGDDYWKDPCKLQKQINFLEANSDYVLCFHPVKILMPDGSLKFDFITNVPDNFEIIETLATNDNYIHTPSVVFRNILQTFPDEFIYSPIGDYFLYVHLAQYGKIGKLDGSMSVYRYLTGIHSSLSDDSKHYNWLFTLLLLSSSLEKNLKVEQFIISTIKKILYSSLPKMTKDQWLYIRSSKYTINLVDDLIFQHIQFLSKNQVLNQTSKMLVIELMNRGFNKIIAIISKFCHFIGNYRK